MMVFIVDSASLAARAFYAASVEEYFNMVQTMIEELNPDYVIHVFDSGEPGFRHSLYPEYKSGRIRRPERVRAAARVADALEKTGHQVVFDPEADDAVASIAAAATTDVVIYSSDTDLWQVMSDRVRCYWCGSSFKDRHIVTLDEVYERYGVHPSLIPEILALAGEASDRIPGVTGLGMVGARYLMTTYGSGANAFEAVDKSEELGRYERKLATASARKEYELSKILATLRIKDVTIAP